MSNDPLQHFHYLFIDHQAPKTLFLFHGTGGDEHDLLQLVEGQESRYNIVSLRGNVSEHGMLRFFRRFGMGAFDQESIAEETGKLAEFLEAWYQKNRTTADDAVFLGFSNGANMILATLFTYPDLISSGVLLHAMLPFKPSDLDLSGKKLLVTYGEKDQMIPKSESERMVEVLEKVHADLQIITHPGGHEIRTVELDGIEAFLQA